MTVQDWLRVAVVTVLAAIGAFFLVRYLKGRKIPRRTGPRIEFRVFSPASGPIDLERLLHEMRDLPGWGPLPHEVGLVASDVRLHLGLVRRENGASAFRPDLFATAEGADDRDAVDRFARAGAFYRVRWTAEKPTATGPALAFCLRAAAALARRATGTLVYDVGADRLVPGERFVAKDTGERVRAIWTAHDGFGRAETKGLSQFGTPELLAPAVDPDRRLLTVDVLSAAGRAVAEGRDPLATVEVEAFGDTYQVVPRELDNEGRVRVHIVRREP